MKAMDRFAFPACSAAGVLLAMLLGGIACLAQVPSPTAPRLVVADVIPQGNRIVPTERIMSIIKTRPGQDYRKDVINEDVRLLYATNQFANVLVQEQEAGDGKVIVYFIFAELPNYIQEIVYNGAKHVKVDELNTLTGLRKGAILNPIANKMACQTIVRHYNDKGRPFASCDLVEGGQPGDTRVVFNIS
jgi:outer membrane protein insertion porin family